MYKYYLLLRGFHTTNIILAPFTLVELHVLGTSRFIKAPRDLGWRWRVRTRSPGLDVGCGGARRCGSGVQVINRSMLGKKVGTTAGCLG